MLEPKLIEERIRERIQGLLHFELKDLTGTMDHYEATVVADGFDGKNLIEQHQLVYTALGDWMRGPIHALALKTFSSEEWKKRERTNG